MQSQLKKGGHLWQYLLVASLQIIFCWLAFPLFFSNAFDASFCNGGDGFKNNFTLLQYVTEPIGPEGIFHFSFFQYPWGEYVYTADNTPLYAMAMRWLHHNVVAMDAYVLPTFNFLLLGNIVLCSLLLFYLGRKIFEHGYWIWLLALSFPWITEQLLRLDRGHYNLSFSSIFVLAVLCCHRYAEARKGGQNARSALLLMILLTLGAYLIHGYYLPILSVFFAVFLYLIHFKYPSRWKPIFGLSALLFIGIVGIVSYGILALTDGYLSLRQTHAMSFNANDQKLFPSYLYQSYRFNTLQFPLRVASYGSFSEPHMYLGHIFWASFASMGIFWLSAPLRFFSSIEKRKAPTAGAFVLFAAFICFTISIGTNLYGMLQEIDWINLWNFDANFPKWQMALALIAGIFSIVFLAAFAISSFRNTAQQIDFSDKKIKRQVFTAWFVAVLFVILYFSDWIRIPSIPNLINPFFYLQKITRIVEQFRSLSRFAWPFILVITIIIFWLWDKKENILKAWQRKGLYAMLTLLAMSQMADVIQYNRAHANLPNMFGKAQLEEITSIDNPEQFAAILPLPFFMVGSEDYNVTIDDVDEFTRWLFPFAYKNQLPMLATKLSRTPVAFSDAMMNLLLYKKADDQLMKLLPDKPLLVVVSERWMIDEPEKVRNIVFDVHIRPKAKAAADAQFDLMNHPDFSLIKIENGMRFYSWDIKKSTAEGDY